MTKPRFSLRAILAIVALFALASLVIRHQLRKPLYSAVILRQDAICTDAPGWMVRRALFEYQAKLDARWTARKSQMLDDRWQEDRNRAKVKAKSSNYGGVGGTSFVDGAGNFYRFGMRESGPPNSVLLRIEDNPNPSKTMTEIVALLQRERISVSESPVMIPRGAGM